QRNKEDKEGGRGSRGMHGRRMLTGLSIVASLIALDPRPSQAFISRDTPMIQPSLLGVTQSRHFETSLLSSPEQDGEEERITPETVAELVEVSFLNACLQLSSGYVDVLKLFIVACKSGYDLDLSLESLHQLVLDCPVNSAGRDLMKEEIDLRREWMVVVYTILNELLDVRVVEVGEVGCDEISTTRVETVVQSMLSIQKQLSQEEEASGGKLNAMSKLTSLTVDQVLEMSSDLSQLQSECDQIQKAFLMNDIRVAVQTFKVLEEERICTEGSAVSSNAVPRPSIPGT
ncbi:hypothetical protein THAOC_08822, partial [Thalassiosira oceanica]